MSKTGMSKSRCGDDHADLGATEDHPIGAPGPASLHDLQIGGLGLRPDDPAAELLIDDAVDRLAVGLVGHHGLDAVALAEAPLVEGLLHGIARGEQQGPAAGAGA